MKSTINHLDKSIQFSLRKRCYDFSKSDSVISKYDKKYKGKMNDGNSKKNVEQNENSKQQGAEGGEDNTFHPLENNASMTLICEVKPENNIESENCADGDGPKSSHKTGKCGVVTDEDVIQVRKEEKKQVITNYLYFQLITDILEFCNIMVRNKTALSNSMVHYFKLLSDPKHCIIIELEDSILSAQQMSTTAKKICLRFFTKIFVVFSYFVKLQICSKFLNVATYVHNLFLK